MKKSIMKVILVMLITLIISLAFFVCINEQANDSVVNLFVGIMALVVSVIALIMALLTYFSIDSVNTKSTLDGNVLENEAYTISLVNKIKQYGGDADDANIIQSVFDEQHRIIKKRTLTNIQTTDAIQMLIDDYAILGWCNQKTTIFSENANKSLKLIEKRIEKLRDFSNGSQHVVEENYKLIKYLYSGEFSREMLDGINEEKGFKVKYVYNNDGGIIGNYIKEEKDKYNLIVMNSFVWSAGVDSSILKEASDTTNLITISNDQTKVHIMQPEGVTMTNSKSIPGQTDNGKKMLGTIDIEGDVDSSQVAIKFRNDNEVKVNVLYKGTYVDRYDGSKTLSATNEYDLIGYWQNGDNRWVHSQVALLHGSSGEKYKQQMKLFKELVKYTLNIDQ